MMYEFDRTEPVTVMLRTMAGHVEIDAGPHETIRVEVLPQHNTEAGRESAENTRVALDGDTLLVSAPNQERRLWRRAPALRITIRVPEGSTISGESASADVRAVGRYRDVRLKLASGDVSITDAIGDVHLTTASGDLSVGRVGGSAYLKCSSGGIRVDDVTGDVTVNTASGDIRLGSGGGSLAAGTASGDIAIGSLREGKARIRTASGDVTVGVAPGTGVWLDLNTSSGDSVTDLAAQPGPSPTAGAPSLDLHVRTASGDIRIHRAATRVAA